MTPVEATSDYKWILHNVAGSLGLSIGQNGCTGICPAILSMIVSRTVGIHPFTSGYIFTVVAVVIFNSFGISSVGGSATVVKSEMRCRFASWWLRMRLGCFARRSHRVGSVLVG